MANAAAETARIPRTERRAVPSPAARTMFLRSFILASLFLVLAGCSRRTDRSASDKGLRFPDASPPPESTKAPAPSPVPSDLTWLGIETLLAESRTVAMVHEQLLPLYQAPSARGGSAGSLGHGQIVVIRRHTGSGVVTGDTLDSWYLVEPLPTGPGGWANELGLTFFPIAVAGRDGLPFAGVPGAVIVDRSISAGGEAWYRVRLAEGEYRVAAAREVSLTTGESARRNEYCAYPFAFSLPTTSRGLTDLLGPPPELKKKSYPNIHVKGEQDTLLSYLYPELLVEIYRTYDEREFLVQVVVTGAGRAMKYGLGVGATRGYVERCLGEPTERRRRSAVYRFSPDVTYEVELDFRGDRVKRIRWSTSFL